MMAASRQLGLETSKPSLDALHPAVWASKRSLVEEIFLIQQVIFPLQL